MSVLHLQRRPESIRRSYAEGKLACSDFEREDSERLAFGIAFHDYVASYWRHLQAVRQETDLTAVRRLAGEAWARTPGLLQSRFDEFMTLAERFADTHTGNLSTLIAVEETQALDVGWAVVTCTVDRVDRLDDGDPDDDPTWVCIWDGKTEFGEMDHEFQIRWYVQMYFLRHPRVERVDFVIDPVRGYKPDEPISFERGDLAEWWDITLDALRRRLEMPRGNPTGGPKCHECALRLGCARSITEARAIPSTEEEADEQLGEHHRLAAGAAVRWEAQREFYRGRDERVVQGELVGFLKTISPSFEVTASPRQLWRWAKRRRRNLLTLFKFAPVRDRRDQDALIVEGLGRMRFKPAQFKTRAHKPLGRKQRRADAPAADGDRE